MRGRAHSNKTRTQANTIDARARAFNKKRELKQTKSMRGGAHSKKNANSNKHDRCAAARIQTRRELTQTMSMRGRAYSKKPRTQTNKVNARARAFKNIANSKKQDQCEGARVQLSRELTQTTSMRRRAHPTTPRAQANNVNVRARAKKRELKQTISM